MKNEVADVEQQAFGHQQTFNEGFEGETVGYGVAVGAFPGGEPVAAATEHTVQRGKAVGDDGEGVGFENLRNILEVVLHLVVSGIYGGFGIEKVFEFEEHQRQAVYENEQVGAPVTFKITKLNF